MKKPLLFLMLLQVFVVFAQVPNGSLATYKFTNGNFTNLETPGVGDLTPRGNGHLFTTDRDGNLDSALRNRQETFDGFTLNATQSNPVNNMTFSFWYKFENNNVAGNVECIMQIFDTQGEGVRINKVSATEFDVRVSTNDVDETIRFTNAALGQSNWAHVMVVIARRNFNYAVNVIVNGNVSSAQGPNVINSTATILNDSAQFILSPIVSQFGLRSATDDIRFYDRELSLADAIQLRDEPGVQPLSRVFVNPDASGDNSGDSWVNATATIQSGISLAASGGEVWVKSGTYKPSTGTNRSDLILIDKNISLYGGFDGTETTFADRDLINNTPTIISGDLQDNDNNQVIDGNTTYNDNSTTLVRVNAADVTIDGFTLQRAYASSASSSTDIQGFGGAIYIDNTTPETVTVSNCIIERNVARGGGAGIFYQPINSGAGQTRVNLNIANSIIRNNASRYGTGIYYFSDHIDANLSVFNTLFYDNKTIQMASGDGAFGSSIWGRSLSGNGHLDIDIVNSTFVDNEELDNGFGSLIPQDRRSTIALTNTDGNDEDLSLTMYNSLFFNNTNLSTTTPCPIGRALGNRGAKFLLDFNLDADGFSEVVPAPPIAVVTNTVTINPSFEDYANDDFRLISASSGVDQGNTSILANYGITTDLLGNQRVINNTVDIGAYEFGSFPLSVDNFALSNSIQTYPNPTSDIIHIKSTLKVKEVILISLTGKEVLRIKSMESSIDISGLNDGVYFLRIETENGTITTKKIIKN